MTEPFNPLAMESLASSIVQQLLRNPPIPLSSIQKFYGAGLYAIYYAGGFPAYEVIREKNINDKWSLPIYVGRAVSPGSRRGLIVGEGAKSTALYNRIREHAKSIIAAKNLDIDDFYVRWLVVEDIWIPLGETALIRATQPVWNAVLDGFGNHDPGKGRRKGAVSPWDTVHRGRKWAEKHEPADKVVEERLLKDVIQYLRERHL